jgi:hypothetical protein
MLVRPMNRHAKLAITVLSLLLIFTGSTSLIGLSQAWKAQVEARRVEAQCHARLPMREWREMAEMTIASWEGCCARRARTGEPCRVAWEENPAPDECDKMTPADKDRRLLSMLRRLEDGQRGYGWPEYRAPDAGP